MSGRYPSPSMELYSALTSDDSFPEIYIYMNMKLVFKMQSAKQERRESILGKHLQS